MEGEDWNDSAIKELQERVYSGDAAGSALEDDQEANGQHQSGDDQRGRLYAVDSLILPGTNCWICNYRFVITSRPVSESKPGVLFQVKRI